MYVDFIYSRTRKQSLYKHIYSELNNTVFELTKGICNYTNTLSSNVEDSELNYFGIFVGPREINEDFELKDFGIFVGPKETKSEVDTEISLENIPDPVMPGPSNPNFAVEADLVIKDFDNIECTNT